MENITFPLVREEISIVKNEPEFLSEILVSLQKKTSLLPKLKLLKITKFIKFLTFFFIFRNFYSINILRIVVGFS